MKNLVIMFNSNKNIAIYSTKLLVPRNGRSKINKDIENKITS